MNISTNLKAIDMIKGEILSEIANLYKTLADYDEIGEYESVTNEIATVIAMDYILARRLGVSFAGIDNKISELLTIGEENGHELEIEFSDMSELKRYLRSR
ncbi:MAG: MazG-like family protein [Clostridia bacterium]|nr:MazG-like family protein [Clostridia bacterium]